MGIFCNLQIKSHVLVDLCLGTEIFRCFSSDMAFFSYQSSHPLVAATLLMCFLKALILVDYFPLVRWYRKARCVLVGGMSFLQLE